MPTKEEEEIKPWDEENQPLITQTKSAAEQPVEEITEEIYDKHHPKIFESKEETLTSFILPHLKNCTETFVLFSAFFSIAETQCLAFQLSPTLKEKIPASIGSGVAAITMLINIICREILASTKDKELIKKLEIILKSIHTGTQWVISTEFILITMALIYSSFIENAGFGLNKKVYASELLWTLFSLSSGLLALIAAQEARIATTKLIKFCCARGVELKHQTNANQLNSRSWGKKFFDGIGAFLHDGALGQDAVTKTSNLINIIARTSGKAAIVAADIRRGVAFALGGLVALIQGLRYSEIFKISSMPRSIRKHLIAKPVDKIATDPYQASAHQIYKASILSAFELLLFFWSTALEAKENPEKKEHLNHTIFFRSIVIASLMLWVMILTAAAKSQKKISKTKEQRQASGYQPDLDKSKPTATMGASKEDLSSLVIWPAETQQEEEKEQKENQSYTNILNQVGGPSESSNLINIATLEQQSSSSKSNHQQINFNDPTLNSDHEEISDKGLIKQLEL